MDLLALGSEKETTTKKGGWTVHNNNILVVLQLVWMDGK